MNVKRMATAGVTAWIVALVYSFIVYGKLLGSEFARYPGVFRSPHQTLANVPLMLVSTLVAIRLRPKDQRRREPALAMVRAIRADLAQIAFDAEAEAGRKIQIDAAAQL